CANDKGVVDFVGVTDGSEVCCMLVREVKKGPNPPSERPKPQVSDGV
ncbi:hypothetical protein CSUI_006442, partial [Cystoisospora suis]